jgi:hypothetical protein
MKIASADEPRKKGAQPVRDQIVPDAAVGKRIDEGVLRDRDRLLEVRYVPDARLQQRNGNDERKHLPRALPEEERFEKLEEPHVQRTTRSGCMIAVLIAHGEDSRARLARERAGPVRPALRRR